MESTPVTRALEVLGIPYTLHQHPDPVRSLEQAARERGLSPAQVLRSLVFRLEGGAFVMVLMPGPGQVSWPKLRRHLGVTRITTATALEVRQVTGYEPGAVSPLGLPGALRILVDRGVLAADVISIGAGMRDAGVILKTEDLQRALRLESGDFAA